MNDLYIMHYGVGHDKGGHSGRYPWGSGENPYGGKKRIVGKFHRVNKKEALAAKQKYFSNYDERAKEVKYPWREAEIDLDIIPKWDVRSAIWDVAEEMKKRGYRGLTTAEEEALPDDVDSWDLAWDTKRKKTADLSTILKDTPELRSIIDKTVDTQSKRIKINQDNAKEFLKEYHGLDLDNFRVPYDPKKGLSTDEADVFVEKMSKYLPAVLNSDADPEFIREELMFDVLSYLGELTYNEKE